MMNNIITVIVITYFTTTPPLISSIISTFNNNALWWLCCSLVVANMHTRNFMGVKKTFLLFSRLVHSLAHICYYVHCSSAATRGTEKKREVDEKSLSGKIIKSGCCTWCSSPSTNIKHHLSQVNSLQPPLTIPPPHRCYHKHKSTNRRVIHGPLTSVFQVTPVWDILKTQVV